MARKKRTVPGFNSSSTADIAFMLLIFFLVTTSMDTDRGLSRQLPPPPQDLEQEEDIIVKERNVLPVRLNANNQLMCGSEYISVNQLREKAKEFIANPNNDPTLPEKHPKEIEFFGSVDVTEKHVISVQNDRGTSYNAYFNVQNELIAAYNELRDELAQSKWNKKYAECTEDQQKAIREYYPQKISEAEPKNYGGKK